MPLLPLRDFGGPRGRADAPATASSLTRSTVLPAMRTALTANPELVLTACLSCSWVHEFPGTCPRSMAAWKTLPPKFTAVMPPVPRHGLLAPPAPSRHQEDFKERFQPDAPFPQDRSQRPRLHLPVEGNDQRQRRVVRPAELVVTPFRRPPPRNPAAGAPGGPGAGPRPAALWASATPRRPRGRPGGRQAGCRRSRGIPPLSRSGQSRPSPCPG